MSALEQLRPLPKASALVAEPSPGAGSPALRPKWWRELATILAFYFAYSGIRDLHGDRPVAKAVAVANARRLMALERSLGIFHEAAIQRVFVHWHLFVVAWDDFYGLAHFLMVTAVLLVLYIWFPDRYRLWRNTLAIATALALVGFATFPVMPPRLLPAHYGFVDTLQAVGGLWNFSHGPVSDLSNQYASMPSLHTVWSSWCAMALAGIARPWWGKALVVLYPLATIFCVIITANHYFADVAAGLFLLCASYLLAQGAAASSGAWSRLAWRRRLSGA